MTRLLASAALLSVISATALAADASVIGDWLVKDGYANIRIDNCGGKMWGIVVWEKAPGLDVENPDPAKRSRPTLGMPVLMGLSPAKEPGKWSGQIYNSNNGKMYDATHQPGGREHARSRGLPDMPLCLTQKWTRVKTPPPNAAPLPPLKSSAPPPAKQTAAKKGAAPAPSEVCLRVADEAAAQERGAKK